MIKDQALRNPHSLDEHLMANNFEQTAVNFIIKFHLVTHDLLFEIHDLTISI